MPNSSPSVCICGSIFCLLCLPLLRSRGDAADRSCPCGVAGYRVLAGRRRPGSLAAHCGVRQGKQGSTQMQADARRCTPMHADRTSAITSPRLIKPDRTVFAVHVRAERRPIRVDQRPSACICVKTLLAEPRAATSSPVTASTACARRRQAVWRRYAGGRPLSPRRIGSDLARRDGMVQASPPRRVLTVYGVLPLSVRHGGVQGCPRGDRSLAARGCERDGMKSGVCSRI
jgi:hypothetical protein